MACYHARPGGELTITRLADTPMKDDAPPEQHAKVVYAHLTSGTMEVSATDWLHPTRTPHQGTTVGLCSSGGTNRELRGIFDTLADGADPDLLDDVHELPFGTYGHLADKYGVQWFFWGEKEQEARRLTSHGHIPHGASTDVAGRRTGGRRGGSDTTDRGAAVAVTRIA